MNRIFGEKLKKIIRFFLVIALFSLPGPKAHGELIVYQSSRRLCVCLCVNIFKHEYLHNQWADCNQILFEASLGSGKGCNMFLARLDWNSGFHDNGKLPLGYNGENLNNLLF